MDNKDKSKDMVGYGRPPKPTQFKPGSSGNPKGRPRKNTAFSDVVRAELESCVVMQKDGKPYKMTASKAIARQHIRKAINGNVPSAEFVLKSLKKEESDQPDNLPPLLEELRETNRQLAAQERQEKDNSAVALNGDSPRDSQGERS